MAITKAPDEITIAKLEVVVMPNGEVLCAGKTVGWVTGKESLGRFLSVPTAYEGDDDPALLCNILRAAIPHKDAQTQILGENLTGITVSKKHRGQSLVTFATLALTPSEAMTPTEARYVGVVVWVPRALWPK